MRARGVYTVYMEMRDAILAAAGRAFGEGGAAGFSLRDIASRVGVTPMAIYRHFNDKQALIDALVDEATEEWRSRVAAIKPCAPLNWLLKIGESFLEFALSEPRKFEAAFLTPSTRALRYPDDFVAGGSPAVTLQMRLVEALAAESRAGTKQSAIELVIVLAALAHGLISLYRAGRIAGGEKAFRALYRRALLTTVQGFGLGRAS